MVLALLAMGLSIGLAVAAYFIWNEVQQLTGTQLRVEAQVEDRIQPLRSSLSSVNQTMQASLSTVNQTLQSERHQIDQQLKKLGEDQRNVGHRVSVLAALMGRSEQGWSLAEVEYLLRIANQRLQLQRDVKTAEQALKAADQRLHDLADPHFLSVREQIARDLEALQVVPAVDIEGISLSLSAALVDIDQLSVAGSRYQPTLETETEDSETRATIRDWRELPRLLWSTLSGLFRIREHDKAVTPMLAPEREYFLRENLRLQLSAARLALLRDEGTQYQTILNTAQDWLNAYFAHDDASVNALAAQLNQLKAIDTAPRLPDISGSLRVLRQQMKLTEQRQILPLVPDQKVPGTTEPALEETPEESEEEASP
jgi:uroporphyrin-3 C-methyltransferase